MSESGVAAGWYPDPDGRPCDRYWDGNAWTLQTRPLTQNTPKPVTSSAVANSTPNKISPGWWVVIIILGILCVIGLAAGGNTGY
jgi:hypothetical protein